MIENQKNQQKFVGNLLWGAFDIVTLGVFEKKPPKNETETEFSKL